MLEHNGSGSDTTPAASHAAGSVLEVDANEFARLIPNHPFAIVDFWAPWCAPCRAFAPVFTEAAKRHPEVLFAKVNTEQEQELAGHFNIRSIPTLMVFRENVIIFAQAGALNAGALEEVLAAAGKLDMDEVRRELDRQEKTGEGAESEPGSGDAA